ITFDEWAERDVTLWEGVDIERIKDILYSAHLMTGIDETLHNLKRNYRLAIISGGLKILADYLKDRFSMDYSFGNELRVNDGRVKGINQVVDFKGKGRILREIADDMGIEIDECAAVGDYINDIPMFKAAGFSVAFNPKDESILQYVDEVIYETDLSRLLKFF
ncbi:MAG: HAD-IB family phosphatase, partial [Candidatus Altiarchaeota archaeon]|nr:HAD-IB family phosphatase [Candidatus Altiarchaeota archaeon]